VGIPLDYCSLVASFALMEAVLLKRLWTRWDRAHYRHQFDHNIGVGNLREVLGLYLLCTPRMLSD